MQTAKFYLIFWSIILVFFSCTETEEISFTSYDSQTNDELTGIYFWHPGEGFVVGGSTWNRAIRLSTYDGGLRWQRDSLFDKQIFSLGYNTQGKVFGLGIEYMVYEFLLQSTDRQRIGDYRFFRSLDFVHPEQIPVDRLSYFSVDVYDQGEDKYQQEADHNQPSWWRPGCYLAFPP